MSVDSYLELFTTLFGWAFYGVLWDVLVGTGIVYLPFLGILIDNWREPAEGGQFGTATGLSLRRMEIELFIALLVVVLAGQPAALTPL
ncbi:MAG: conjugal transfer protein TraG N-terminal domain-containing protein, partial [Sedimenticolaceae bacterium]